MRGGENGRGEVGERHGVHIVLHWLCTIKQSSYHIITLQVFQPCGIHVDGSAGDISCVCVCA